MENRGTVKHQWFQIAGSRSPVLWIAVACMAAVLLSTGTSDAQEAVPPLNCDFVNPVKTITFDPRLGPGLPTTDTCDTDPWGLQDVSTGDVIAFENNTDSDVTITFQAGLFTNGEGELVVPANESVCARVLATAQENWAYWFNSNCQDRERVQSRPRIIIVARASGGE